MKSWFFALNACFLLATFISFEENALIFSSNCPIGKPSLLGLRLARGLAIQLPIWSHHILDRHLENLSSVLLLPLSQI